MTVHGAAHIAGNYHINTPATGSFLLDGFELIKGLGFDAVKVQMSYNFATSDYDLETWSGAAATLTEMAQLSEMSTLFGDATCKHYIINTFGFVARDDGDPWKYGISSAPTMLTSEYTEIYNFAVHLMTTYAGTGKTFVLKNWEGDWALQGDAATYGFNNIDEQRCELMAEFYRTRYRAIEDARRATAHSGVSVLSAFECNRVVDALYDRNIPRAVNKVLPRLRGAIDLVSYSAYDSIFDLSLGYSNAWRANQATLISSLQTNLAASISRLQDAAGAPCMIGEWGIPETDLPGGYDAASIIQAVYDVVNTAACPYHIYWQVFNNEDAGNGRGYYLYKLDGTKSGAGNKFTTLLA